MTTMRPLTTYDVAERVALLRLDRPERPQRDQHARCSSSCSATSSAPAATRRCARSWSPRPTTWGSRPAPTCASSSTPAGSVRRMQLFAELYDVLTGFPKPTVAACHGACVGGGAEIAVACDLRVGGSNLRLRFPGAALGRPGRARRGWSRSAGSRSPSTCCSPRRRSTPTWPIAGASCTRSSRRRAPRRRRSSSRSASPSTRPRPSRSSSGCCTSGTTSRSAPRAEGEGQVEWAAHGPGPSVPRIAQPVGPTRHARTRKQHKGSAA